jgi:hypothetical protein
VPYGTISGLVYRDVDSNGAYTPGVDTPLANARVELYNQSGGLVGLVVTPANGRYRFDFLDPNRTYRLKETPPSGYAAAPNDDQSVFILAGEPVTIDFGHLVLRYVYMPSLEKNQTTRR